MKKQIPILFSTPMVQAILAGRKSMTRRTVKVQPIIDDESGYVFDGHNLPKRSPFDIHNWKEPFADAFSVWVPTDLLYVREEYYQLGHWEEVPDVKTKGGRMKWKFVPDSNDIAFVAPASFRKGRYHKDPYTSTFHKRLGRFMPRKYARIWLEVTDIRVERLQDISEADAIAEGIEPFGAGFRVYTVAGGSTPSPIGSFSSLFESINGIEVCRANPWVWVVSFKVLSTTGKPAELAKEVASC